MALTRPFIFYNLSKEKQVSIITAALKEVVSAWFDKASTHENVRNTAACKKSLFSYFSNKKYFYVFSLDRALLINEKILQRIGIDKKIYSNGLKLSAKPGSTSRAAIPGCLIF